MSEEFIKLLGVEIERLRDLSMPHLYDNQNVKDVGDMLTQAFSLAGYRLDLHQKGIAGTVVIAIKK